MRNEHPENPRISGARAAGADLDFEIEFFRGIIKQSPGYVDALAVLGDAYTRKGLYEEGLAIDRRLTELRPGDPIAHYNLACSYSLLRRKREALRSLHKSIVLGYWDLQQILTDRDLVLLHDDRSFQRMVRRLGRKLLFLLKGA